MRCIVQKGVAVEFIITNKKKNDIREVNAGIDDQGRLKIRMK